MGDQNGGEDGDGVSTYTQGIVINNPDQFIEDFLGMKNGSCHAFHSIDGSFMKDFFDRPCVYFLVKDGMIVYIGQTKHLLKRINQHQDKHEKQFDGFKWIFTDTIENAIIIEGKLIASLGPKYNKTNGSFGESISNSLGLSKDAARRYRVSPRKKTEEA